MIIESVAGLGFLALGMLYWVTVEETNVQIKRERGELRSEIIEYHTDYLANNPENYHTRAPFNNAFKM